jgi:alkaline phosphatase
MDDMIGAMLDIDDGVQEILDWIALNGGWEKNALYVTSDHDHYLTLLDDFPETLANLLINGESHNITPQNNSRQNPWSVGIGAGLHEDASKTTTEHIAGLSTWTEDDIANVSHFWGPRGSGGNGWGSHSARPVGLHFMGDEGCINALEGTGFQVLGRHVEGSSGKVDQMHLHACMLKQLYGL